MVRASTLALGLFSIAALGSTTTILAEQDRQTFSAKTTLLTVDVTALDRDGKPVPGLRAEEFEVKVNGKAQPVQTVAFLEAPRAGSPTPSGADSIAGVSGRRSVANLTPGAEARTFVIFVDDIAFEALDGRALFLSAMDFARRLPRADYVGYVASSGVDSVNPTRDRAPVLAALKSAVGRYVNPARAHNDPPIMSIGEALQIVENGNTGLVTEVMLRECFDPRVAATMTGQSIENLQRVSPCAAVVPFRATHIAEDVKALRARQIQAVESAIESLHPLQGIKHFILLTNGLAVGRDLLDLVPVARASARAGVEVSTMVQEGDIDLSDVGSSPDGASAPVSPGQAQKRREDNQILLGGAQTMTDMAGGQFYRVIGQPRRFFDFVQSSASAVYRLGVALPPEIPPGRDVEITASVKRQGVSALASHHAAAPAIETALPAEEQMKNAVHNGESLYGVPIAFGAIVRRSGAPGQLEVGAVARIPATVDGPLNAVFGVLDESGALKTGNRTVSSSAGDYLVTLAIPVTPGTFSLRLAVVDAKGHVGAVAMPLNATLTPVGPLEASDLLTWVSDETGRMRLVVFEDLPPGINALTAMIELYPRASAAPNVSVRFEIVDASGKTMADSPATMTAGTDLIRADAKLDVAALTPGLYGLRGAVSISGTIVGTVSTTFRKQ